MANSLLLDLILAEAQRLRSNGERVQFFFDIDSTLLCVSPRTQQILRDFAAQPKMKQLFPQACEILQTVEATPRDWGIRQILERYQIKETLTFFEAIRNFWAESFFSSSYLQHDEPYKGAVDFVNWCVKQQIEVGYLTGRDEPRMGAGTRESLKQHGFPVSPARGLNMKPHNRFEDGQFKVDFFSQKLQSEPSIHTWFFENEPVILNQVMRTHPQVRCIFLDTVHSGREVVSEEVPRLSFEWNWSRTDSF